jgi:hypothetical protein
MSNSIALVAALRAAGFESGNTHVVKPGKIELRIPDVTAADMPKVEAAIPAIESCGYDVVGYGAGLRSDKDNLVGASIFLTEA